MEKEQRNRLQKATQDARKLLEEEFRSQLLQTYDIDVEKVRWTEEPGAHLQAEQRLIREKLLAWIEHKEAQINDRKEALLLALREMAFTALNRFVALKLMEARKLVRPCVSGGLESAGFLEFTAVAQGLLADQESSYRLYLETIFEDVSRELRALFDPRDPASLLWPKRAALLELLDILNRPELAELWIEDETLGWVYQYFNGDAERKKMREESSAPRNSRELAVRNQFFTPRYVVEFLIDNTLGRIWYEMRQGSTGLKDRCRYLVRRPNEVWLQPGEEPPAQPDTDETPSQEELLRQPVYIPHRPLKDPREIRMLDPACGSMHFGLYAFDLYLEIYKEAWEIAQGSDEQPKQEEAFSPFVVYAAGFADKSAFLREVPRLILQHNIHGVDIDPRATQIARLTLWLRAQRAWKEQQLEVVNRPPITRSNVVCAEPMPGEPELLADFVDQQFPEAEQGLVQQLLEAIFDKMGLAGEAGSLLKIEDEIRDSIDQAQKEWRKLAVQQQDLFSSSELAALGELGASLNNDLQNLTKDFWINLEERIYVALNDFAKQSENGTGYRRQLFAEDAAQGFAFIELCRKRYDAMVMNPPFGLMSSVAYKYAVERHPNSYCDFGIAFMDRGLALADHAGLTGAITSRSFMSVTDAEKFRVNIAIPNVQLIVDLGLGVMDGAWVDSSCQIFSGHSPEPFIHFVKSRGEILIPELLADLDRQVVRDRSDFLQMPRARLSYEVDSVLSNIFARNSDGIEESGIALSRTGASTFEDERFRRICWEVNPSKVGPQRTWCFVAKSCEFNLFYYPYDNLVKWNCSGDELAERNRQVNGQTAQARQGSSFYFKSGISFSRRGEPTIAFRVYPSACTFSSNGAVVLPIEPKNSLYLLGLLNSSWVRAGIHTQAHKFSYSVGHSKSIRWIEPAPQERDSIESSVCAILEHKRWRFSKDDRDPNFVVPFDPGIASIGEWFALFRQECKTRGREMSDMLANIDKVVAKTYDLPQEGINWKAFNTSVEDIHDPEDIPYSSENELGSCVVAYIFGTIFGRWDIRYATGQKPTPELPDPLASLAICPPGLLQGDNGLPLSSSIGRKLQVEGLYPLEVAWEGVLVDDSEHPLDLVCHVHSALEVIWGDRADAIQQEACELLGVLKLREWFRQPANFFADHLKRYSKSRRQAPIYWQLSAGSGSYSVWLYYHRFTQDTLYRVLHDFVGPRIQQAEREQFELESQGSLSGEAASRLHEAQNLLQDLRILKNELDLVAPIWNPNLNDGVIINHAILWRITPYTPWQKKCKECWDKLVKGDYDWAHLAFHLWPERVIPKCTSDRSLAIAHGLEERLWQETNNGNWLPLQLTEADLQTLIAEHSNPAVKSALERFLAAPPPVAPTRTRASRSIRASGSSTPRRARGSAAVVDAEATRQVLLALTAAPSDGLAKTQIADLIGVEANALTAVIKQLKESGQIDQLGERRGARYLLSEQGRAAVASQAGEDD